MTPFPTIDSNSSNGAASSFFVSNVYRSWAAAATRPRNMAAVLKTGTPAAFFLLPLPELLELLRPFWLLAELESRPPSQLTLPWTTLPLRLLKNLQTSVMLEVDLTLMVPLTSSSLGRVALENVLVWLVNDIG